MTIAVDWDVKHQTKRNKNLPYGGCNLPPNLLEYRDHACFFMH